MQNQILKIIYTLTNTINNPKKGKDNRPEIDAN